MGENLRVRKKPPHTAEYAIDDFVGNHFDNAAEDFLNNATNDMWDGDGFLIKGRKWGE